MSILLIDADGVMCDFAGAYISVLNRFARTNFTVEDVTEWSFFDSPKLKDLLEFIPNIKDWMEHYITQTRGFGLSLDPLPGARDGVRALRDAGNKVYCVTSPWHSSEHWHHERVTWLQIYMDFKPKDIIFASDKSVVAGHVLVDDKPENLATWKHGRGVLWDQPWNRRSELTRTKAWDEVLKMCRCWK